MKICITLDDVLRAKTLQVGKVYKKYIDPDIDLEALDLSTNDYSSIFGFKDTHEWRKFLYDDYGFEIFGNAPCTEKGVNITLNLWHISLEDYDNDDEVIELMLANPYEFNTSIPYTYFFLSKAATRIREAYFPLDSSTIWDKCDVLVTADPKLIEEKPDGKQCIRIKMPYNEACEKADKTYDKLSDLLTDEGLLDELVGRYKKEQKQ